MSKIVELINSLPDMLPLKPATEVQITDAELQLRVRFADEYKEYLVAFGAIMADGIELTGIAKSEHRNVVSLTKKERELNPKVHLRRWNYDMAGHRRCCISNNAYFGTQKDCIIFERVYFKSNK